MVHFLNDPKCLGTMKKNRAALPKRPQELQLGTGNCYLTEGWGLHFVKKVWSLPIAVVQMISVVSAIIIAAVSAKETGKGIETFVPAAFVILLGQSVAALMQKWADSNVDEKAQDS